MYKVLKLILVVLIALVIGVWSARYDNYLILVIGDTSVQINLMVIFFSIFVVLFLALLSYRSLRIIKRFFMSVFSFFKNITLKCRKDKLCDLIANMVFEENTKLANIKLQNIKIKDNKKYALYMKLNALAYQDSLYEIKVLLEQNMLDNDKVCLFYKALVDHAQGDINQALESLSNSVKLHKSMYKQAFLLYLDCYSSLDNYDINIAFIYKHLKEFSSDSVVFNRCANILLDNSPNVKELKKAYKFIESMNVFIELEIKYIDKLKFFTEENLAKKILLKKIKTSAYKNKFLEIYLSDMVYLNDKQLLNIICNDKNLDFYSILTLLETIMIKGTNQDFDKVHSYIRHAIYGRFDDEQLKKYNTTMVLYYTKNKEPCIASQYLNYLSK